MNSDGVLSPYGGKEVFVESINSGWLVEMYKMKSGYDVSHFFSDIECISLYQCSITGYRYWKPFSVAGNEEFYRGMASSCETYYPAERWEYSKARTIIKQGDAVLDVSCGQGYFLKSIEDLVSGGRGLEFSQYAIDNKMTKLPIENSSIQSFSKEKEKFDVVCAFQVLEHIVGPNDFIQGCLNALKPGGKLVISTPNYSSLTFKNKEDAWDLPPHHVGHYSASVFCKIADIHGLKIVLIEEQTKKTFNLSKVTPESSGKLLYKIYRGCVMVAGRLVARVIKEPEHSIVVIFEKENPVRG